MEKTQHTPGPWPSSANPNKWETHYIPRQGYDAQRKGYPIYSPQGKEVAFAKTAHESEQLIEKLNADSRTAIAKAEGE